MHLVVGPNGAGKTTFFERVLSPVTRLPVISADVLARPHRPGDEAAAGRDATGLAAQACQQALAQGLSFVAETVFSHPAELDLLRQAQAAGYLVQLHAILVPEALSLARAPLRHAQGGQAVPPAEISERYQRLWPLVAQALARADSASVVDNSSARRPFRVVARYEQGRAIGPADLPAWSPCQGPAAANTP